MKITRENIDNLNAVLSINIEKQDYEKKVVEALNDYRKKVRIDGFRPGKVPPGLINKMYRKPVLAEEINKIVTESLTKYLQEEKLNILGEPLPKEEGIDTINWATDEVFNFKFDLGLAPDFDAKVTHKDKYPYYSIRVDDELIEKYVDNYTRRFGEFVRVDSPTEKDILKASIQQLDANNEPLLNGIRMDEALLPIDPCKEDSLRKKMLSASKEETLLADLRKAYPNESELAGILKIDRKDIAAVEGNFAVTVKEFSHFRNAEINQELFDKIYDAETVKSKEEFLAKIAEEAKIHLKHDSDYRFRIDVKEILVKKTKITLPQEFLKRWLYAINEGKFTREQIDKDFDQFEEDLKWQLIKDKIISDNALVTSDDDLKQAAKDIARLQFSQYGMNNVPDEHLVQFAQRMLEKNEDRNNIKSKVVENKVIEFVRRTVKIDEKEVSTDKFNKLFEK